MTATPEMIAAAWATWHSRHGGKLGPGPAFVEAINAALALQSAADTPPSPYAHMAGETVTRFHIEWIAAARPPVHPNPMTGKTTFNSFERAVSHMKSQAADAEFVSLVERTTVTTSVDRSAELRSALAATATEGPK